MKGGIWVLLMTLPILTWSTDFTFGRYYAEQNYGGNGAPGFVRAGDMDGDGDLDLVAGGGRALFVYENDGNPAKADWTRYGDLDGSGNMGLNGASLYDVDGDNDLDVVGAKYYQDLGWWEHPGQLNNNPWTFHRLAGENYYQHCQMRADLDRDGKAEEFIFNLISGSNLRIKWGTPGADPGQLWQMHTVESGRNHGNNNHAGLDTGDIDKDGHLDIAYSNGWYEAPDGPAGTWTWHQVTTTSGISNVALRDLDNDGDLDLITGSGHHATGVFWFECPSDPKTGAWTKHTVDAAIVHPEGLAVLDLDCDGDFDVVACDLNFDHWDQQVHHVYVYENTGTKSSPAWNKQNISGNSYASHKLQVADINNDGKMDIISEGCGYKIVSYYENRISGICAGVGLPRKANAPLSSSSISLMNPVGAATPLAFGFHDDGTNHVHARILDVSGRVIRNETLYPAAPGRFQFSSPFYSHAGLYLLAVTTADGSLWQKKFTLLK